MGLFVQCRKNFLACNFSSSSYYSCTLFIKHSEKTFHRTWHMWAQKIYKKCTHVIPDICHIINLCRLLCAIYVLFMLTIIWISYSNFLVINYINSLADFIKSCLISCIAYKSMKKVVQGISNYVVEKDTIELYTYIAEHMREHKT